MRGSSGLRGMELGLAFEWVSAGVDVGEGESRTMMMGSVLGLLVEALGSGLGVVVVATHSDRLASSSMDSGTMASGR